MTEMSPSGTVDFLGYVESAGTVSTIQIKKEYQPALLGLEKFSHAIILYWFHLRDNDKHRTVLQVTPPRHKGAPLTGVFGCRSPSRPNPIGHTIVKIESIEGGCLKVTGLDALLGSPIVDIKPYMTHDCIREAYFPEYYRD